MRVPDAETLSPLVDAPGLPRVARLRYEPPTPTVSDLTGATTDALGALPIDLPRGATVAIGVGSRGITDIADVVEIVVDELRARGYEPIVVPAMGSHGGGTAEGQRAVLAELGITEDRLGCSIDDRMDTEPIGELHTGDRAAPIPFSRAALEADAVLPINRIAPHTSFGGEVESGICKMLVVGFGKREGARLIHRVARAEGFVPTLEAVLAAIRASVSVPGGIGIVENADAQTADVVPIAGEDLIAAEAEVLPRARKHLATLPFETVDLLVVDAIGKDISGTGMDPNVIGRRGTDAGAPPTASSIERIYVRGLSPGTHGNANGVGLADAIHRDVTDAIDLEQTYANVLTSGYPHKAALPPIMPTDEIAVNALINSLGPTDPDGLRFAWIEHTGQLSRFRASAALVEAVEDPALTVEQWESLAFESGTLVTRPD